MHLIPIHTPIIKSGDDLAAVLARHEPEPPVGSRSARSEWFMNGDILAISSKVVATAEGTRIDLASLSPSPDAGRYARATGRSAPFMQAVIGETARMGGRIIGASPGALLTEVRPEGLPRGTILTANAGLDESNVELGYAVGWPKDPVASAVRLKRDLESLMASPSPSPSSPTLPPEGEGRSPSTINALSDVSRSPSPAGGGARGEGKAAGTTIAIIITDSTCHPRRSGVTAFALACAGIDPFLNRKGEPDLFGRVLRITSEAVCDQLATAANFLMGNAGQSIPAVLIRGHGLPLGDFAGWVPGIEPGEDLFRGSM